MKSTNARLLRSGDRAMAKPTAHIAQQMQEGDTELEVPRPLESGVYVTAPDLSKAEASRADLRAKELVEQVTLVVYGWHNVQPGTLSWVFPSVTAAVSAARAMTNAVRWAIVRGRRSTPNLDVEAERASGLVLVES